MAARFMVKNKKGFYLRREAKNNSGCTGWAMEKELALVYDDIEEARRVIDQLPGSAVFYTISLLSGVAGQDDVYSFNFMWQHREGYRSQRRIENLTEIEMINKIFEEARENNFPIIMAKVQTVEPRTKQSTRTPSKPNDEALLMQRVEKSL